MLRVPCLGRCLCLGHMQGWQWPVLSPAAQSCMCSFLAAGSPCDWSLPLGTDTRDKQRVWLFAPFSLKHNLSSCAVVSKGHTYCQLFSAAKMTSEMALLLEHLNQKLFVKAEVTSLTFSQLKGKNRQTVWKLYRHTSKLRINPLIQSV